MEAAAEARPVAELVDKQEFQKLGYTVVKRLFDPGEIEELRTTALAAVSARQERGMADVSADGAVRSTGDILSISELRTVLLDRRLIGAIRELLGGAPAYFGDSSVRIGAGGRLGWECHRDNVDKVDLDGPDWVDPYPLVRCGLYLEDHARHSAGLGVIPSSHRGPAASAGRRRIVPSEVGDLVVWDLRILHTGQMTRFRPLPSVALPPRLGGQLARLGLEVPEERERIALFLTFGLPGDHLTRYLEYLKTRDYALEGWARSSAPREVWQEARAAGLQMISVSPFYVPSDEKAAV